MQVSAYIILDFPVKNNMTINPKDKEEKQLLDSAIVSILYVRGKKQNEIAEILNYSQSKVSSLLVKSNFINREPTLKGNAGVYQGLVDKILSQEDEKRFLQEVISKNKCTEIKIIGVSGLTNEDKDKKGIDSFAAKASPIIADWIKNYNEIGVTYGRTLLPFLKPLTAEIRIARSSTDGSKLQFIPVCPQNPHGAKRQFCNHWNSSTALSLRFNNELYSNDNQWNTESDWETYSLEAVPSFRPYEFYDNDIVTKYESAIAPDRKIVEEKIRKTISCILTGVGTSDLESYYSSKSGKGWLEEEGLKPENLKNYVAGDIAGILLPKLDCNKLESIHSINNKLQIFYPARLNKFLQRCIEHELPGIILIAYLNKKAEVVEAALREGYVSRLIVSEDIVESILERNKNAYKDFRQKLKTP